MLKGWTLSQDEEQVKEFTFAIAVLAIVIRHDKKISARNLQTERKN